MNQNRKLSLVLFIAVTVSVTGCYQHHIHSADKKANRIIRQRQQQALGAVSDFEIGDESGITGPGSDPYAFVPHPIDSDIPETFRSTQEKTELDDIDTTGTSVDTTGLRPFTLADSLKYAFKNARDFQTRKETLYLSALNLMTERQLWTPQIAGRISTEYANYGQTRDFDQAMTTIAQLSASQRLPYGGEIAARVVNSFMRDIGRHTTSGETGTTILQANIPLLRGAGRVAYESRYQAERNLIYAVRDFEASRRDLVVSVAGDYFNLLTFKTQIESAQTALESAKMDLQRSQAMVDVERILQVEADRANVQVLETTNDLNNARVLFETALDRFKIRIGMSTDEKIDIVEADLNLNHPYITTQEGTKAALTYRLDLLNSRDAIDDAHRGVEVARNNFLPQFDFSGSVTMRSDPAEKNSTSYNTERTTWRGMLEMDVPLDQRQERNEFRAALVNLRRAERNYDLAKDNVRVDVRRALRNVELAKTSMQIQEKNIAINVKREETARAQFERGRLSSNRDVFEATRALQNSKNRYAAQLADYRLAILSFLRDTGTLRVDDNGHWAEY